ncbi:MAG: amino acid permease, partial [Alphaproteobacteria bacterium]
MPAATEEARPAPGEAGLRRRVGLALLVLYGVGTMVGAGIYVLVGAVAGAVGIWAPLAFALAALVALPTALTYAELSSRVPEAGGAAAFIARGLDSRAAALLVGLAIAASGTISAAAVLRGGVGYLTAVVDLPPPLLVILVGLLLTLVASLGIAHSLAVAAAFTLAEVGGLVAVIAAGASAAPSPDYLAPAPLPLAGLGFAVILCFYAFLGFEDMANLGEEAIQPTRTLPRAYVLAILLVTLLYALVSWAAVRAVPVAELAASPQPLTLVWQAGFGGEARFLAAIAVLAALNGILAQLIMASRLLYGLGRDTPALGLFHHTHARTGTPLRATLL